MAYEVVMPRLGWNMETGALSSWRKQDGDFVNAGDILLEVESEKAVQEVEALESGILHIPPGSPSPGQVVPVGTPLAYLLQEGEELPVKINAPPGQALNESRQTHSSAPTKPVPTISGRKAKAISPRAARVAAELGIDWSNLKGSGRTGRIVERDVREWDALQHNTSPSSIEARFSPVARRLAQDMGLDLDILAAQMPGKRIERTDVETAIRAALKAAPHPGKPSSEKVGVKAFARTVQPISPIRQITADRLASSAHTAAGVTLTTEADATELVRLRRQLKDDEAPHIPTYTDMIICLTAHALVEHPALNAHFDGETIIQPGVVNMGLAVDTERGLLVPVLLSAHSKSLRQIAQESEVLIGKARSGRIQSGEMQEGTFTITNLGMYEIDAFTPIINLPECAVLGVGRIIPKQVVVEADTEQVAIRHMLSLSLTFDHRLVDGAPAARFLQRVKQLVEKPYLWLGN
jgi:pyruvate dehydrogenase E2 component (dihydrolipoamide acetyltransferase)